MEQSLLAAVSGIQANQTYLDVVGSNVANSNTTGYKTQDAVFTDLLAEQVAGASAPVAGSAGTNPVAVGAGVRVAAVTSEQTQGALMETNQPTDLAIQGNGYLIAVQNGATVYTRAGHLALDANGDLSTPVGGIIQGWMAPAASPAATGPIQIQLGSTNASGATLNSFSIGTDGTITGTYSDGTSSSIGQIALATFANPGGLASQGNTNYAPSANSGNPVVNPPGTGGAGQIIAGSLEGSNVDLASQLTDLIVAQEAYQANTKVVSTTSNSLNSLMQMT